ncbi:MAG: DUF1284 domain-containing protein [Nitrospirota bacterium]
MSSLSKPAIKLRGHHLICLHFFSGKGYNSEFVSNLRKVLERAEAGEEIEVCSGADDICKKCPYLKEERCLYGRDAEDEIGEMDRRAIKLLSLKARRRVRWVDIKEKIPEILHEWSRDYCKECDWRKACGHRAWSRERRGIAKSMRIG